MQSCSATVLIYSVFQMFTYLVEKKLKNLGNDNCCRKKGEGVTPMNKLKH